MEKHHTVIFVILLSSVSLWPRAEGVSGRARSTTSYRYSRYSYSPSTSSSSSTYARYTYRYSSSYDSYRSTSVVYTPTTYSSSSSYSYSYYTGLYYSYYYYTYYSYYYGGTCTYSSSGSYSSDSCSMSTTTTAAPTTAPATITCPSGTTLSSSTGVFNSHNAYGSNNYASSMSCSWIIAASAGYVVQLSFVAFNTEKNFDYVKVYDGSSSSATLLGSFDGSSSADYSYPGSTILYSSGQYMYVTFTSDSSITKDGFSALYQQVLATANRTVVTVAPTAATTANPLVTYCSGVTALNASSTATIYSHSGSSGQLPSATGSLGNYLNSMNCTWTVQGRSGYYLQLYVAYMNLESCYDKVTIYQTGQTSSTRVYCDASTPVGYSAMTSLPLGAGATVRFTSDFTVTARGFLMTYAYVTTVDSPSIYNSNSSYLTSSASTYKTNNVCRNYQVNVNGSAMGSFTCPNPFEPSDYTQCCGEDDMQYCCKLQDNKPMIIGIVVGIVVLVIVVSVIVYCTVRSCREGAAKKSGSAVKWRRTMNKARAITAWKLATMPGGGHGAAAGEVGAAGPHATAAAAVATTSAAPVPARSNLYASVPTDPPTFSPPPVPPPSQLYYGTAYPPGNPPAYATIYPPMQPHRA